ncbi:DUF2510 domain-containing protein [Demequina sp. SYSU T00039]|uniref:DUF2510 domain-containing protein n=1 Tax=Demequina lignilytica TaxID=3051663 RepID=A0AAW7M5Z5_9MICO|nr:MULTISPECIES: DUF2510 domain-containing protein [unclassified Demequina]MDN4477998.1 DUF2510 domain-containing protein [Demequina sp. SYSU T00039-1]MDN4488552.1 DUF2510 domain-containing protein [Demequina sp. SYSU T00039]
MSDQTSAPAATEDYAAPPELPPALPPAGWYSDPAQAGMQRYWDGAAWTQHRQSQPAASASAAPPRRRGRVVLAVVGGIAAVAVVGSLVYSGVTQAIAGVTGSAGDSRALTAAAPATGVEVPVMGGRGTITLDPSWEDISEVSGTDAMEAQIVEETGIDSQVAGAWLLAGDLVDGGVALLAYSAGDVGGPSAPRIEAHAFLQSSTAGIDDVVVTSEGAVTTAAGLDGYIIEYGFPLYGIQLTNAIGVVVEGSSVMIVSTNGNDELGSGVAELESVLNSLTLD